MKQAPLVLIVDDAQDNREGYAQYLEYCGFRTAEASTGDDALRQAFELRPDAIVLDMRLPGISGQDVTRKLRGEGFSATPIIALSACVFERDVAEAREAGCDAFLAKPCVPETVVAEIKRLLAERMLGS